MSLYQIPTIKNVGDYGSVVYIDPDYTGANGSPNGTESRPYTNMNTQYSSGIPFNTAFLFKRGTSHPKVGNSSYKDMIYSKNMIGAYGEGERPIIDGIWVASNSDDLTIRDLNIQYQSQNLPDAYDIIINFFGGDGSRPTNMVVAHNIINGVYNPQGSWTTAWGPRPYPHMGMRGGSHGSIAYNNIVSNVGNDGIYFDAAYDLRIVRNYIFNVNRMHWGRGLTDPPTGGDAILLGWSFDNAYVANNYCDPARDYYTEYPEGDDFWKHTFIANASSTGGWDSPNAHITAEYNTFISPAVHSQGSGGVIYYNPSENSSFRYNLIKPTQGEPGRGALRGSGYTLLDHLAKDQPYGIYENHIIRENSNNVLFPDDDQAVLDAGNEIFDTFAEYDTYLETNDAVGSDIDPDNFWIEEEDPPPPPPTGQATIRDYSTNNVTSDTSSITIDKPANVREGNILLVTISAYRVYSGDVNASVPTGWNTTLAHSATTGHGSIIIILAYKIAGASEPSNYQFGFGGSCQPVGTIFRIAGANTFNPIDTFSQFFHASWSVISTIEAPTVTASNDNSLLIALGASRSSSNAITITSPSGMKDEGMFNMSNTSYDFYTGFRVASEEIDLGSTGSRTFTDNNGSMRAAFLIVVNSKDEFKIAEGDSTSVVIVETQGNGIKVIPDTVLPAIQSYSSNSSSEHTTSLTINKPSGTVESSLLFVIIAARRYYSGDPIVTPPVGWNVLISNSATHGYGSVIVFAATKTAGSSEPSNYQFNFEGNVRPVGVINRLTKAYPPNSINVFSQYFQTGTWDIESTIVAPSVNTTVDNSLIIAVGASRRSSLPLVTMTKPVEMTDLGLFHQHNESEEESVGLRIAHEDVLNPSTVGDRVFTENNGSMAFAGLFVVNPNETGFEGPFIIEMGLWSDEYAKLNAMFGELYSHLGQTHTPYGEAYWEVPAKKLNTEFTYLYDEILLGTPPHTFTTNQSWGTVRGYMNTMFTQLYTST